MCRDFTGNDVNIATTTSVVNTELMAQAAGYTIPALAGITLLPIIITVRQRRRWLRERHRLDRDAMLRLASGVAHQPATATTATATLAAPGSPAASAAAVGSMALGLMNMWARIDRLLDFGAKSLPIPGVPEWQLSPSKGLVRPSPSPRPLLVCRANGPYFVHMLRGGRRHDRWRATSHQVRRLRLLLFITAILEVFDIYGDCAVPSPAELVGVVHDRVFLLVPQVIVPGWYNWQQRRPLSSPPQTTRSLGKPASTRRTTLSQAKTKLLQT